MVDRQAAKSPEQTNTLVRPEAWRITKIEQRKIQSLMADAVGVGGVFNPLRDMTPITIPGAGATTWVYTALGKTVETKELSGILVLHHVARSYWEDDVDDEGGGNDAGGGKPPDCFSPDGINGIGYPGGACNTCVKAEYGSDRRKRGQACKQMLWLYLMTAERVLPRLIPIPPTGINPARDYIMELAANGYALTDVLTGITLETKQNPEKKKYSVPVFTHLADAPEALANMLATYSTGLRLHLPASGPGALPPAQPQEYLRPVELALDTVLDLSQTEMPDTPQRPASAIVAEQLEKDAALDAAEADVGDGQSDIPF